METTVEAPKKLSKKAQTREDALKELRTLLKPGTEVKVILRNVARSGMSRTMDFFVGDYHCITWLISELGIGTLTKNGLRVGGCGMDMGFHTVYELGHAVWPKGTDAPHGTRNGKPDSDGGYALKHRWI